MLAYWPDFGPCWVNVGCMLSWVGRVRCALHWEEKEVGREPRGLGGKILVCMVDAEGGWGV